MSRAGGPLRIVFTIPAMGRGGAEIQVRDLAMRLKERGHAVAIAVLLPFEEFEDELRAHGVETISLGMRKGKPSLWPVPRFLSWARRFAPDVVHGHMFAGSMLARVASTALRPRPTVVSTCHSVFEHRVRFPIYSLTDPLCDAFSFVSQDGFERHLRWHATRRAKAFLLPNGVDLAAFHPAPSTDRARARRDLGVGDELVWLAIGSFRDEAKDYGSMLRAFAASSRPTSLLLIAGHGALLEEKRALARTLGIEARVRFLGLRTDVPRLLAAADAFVLSSAYEGLSVVLLEAAASALPVVATNVGSNGDVLEGGAGLLVPPKDVAALGDAMATLERMTADERAALGATARRRVIDRYDLERVTAQWEALYERLVGRVSSRDSPPLPT